MIQIRTETRDMIKSLGHMGETYDEVLQRMYRQASENILAQALLDTTNSKPIEQILRERKLHGQSIRH